MGEKSNNESDRDAWLRYTSGSNQALAELVEKYNSRLTAYLASLGSKDPEGSCQELWRIVVEKQDLFDGRSFSGWAFEIARNLCYGQGRKAKTRKESNLSPDYDAVGDDGSLMLLTLEQREMAGVIRSCMETAGEVFVTAFRLTLDGAKTKDIAKELGVAEGTVSSRVSRAKKSIKDCVEGKMA